MRFPAIERTLDQGAAARREAWLACAHIMAEHACLVAARRSAEGGAAAEKVRPFVQ